LPWVVTPAVSAWRLLDSTPLPPPGPLVGAPPRVSVIVPARNEVRNIERLVRSVLATTWPDLELIVVDDHSSDGTGALARTAGHGDPRLVVFEPPSLPEGWFGKQWACWCGAQRATGDRLLFADADTWHAPGLVARMVRAQDDSAADLLSVAGTQELRTFGERVVMPLPFLFLLRWPSTCAHTGAWSRCAPGSTRSAPACTARSARSSPAGRRTSMRAASTCSPPRSGRSSA